MKSTNQNALFPVSYFLCIGHGEVTHGSSFSIVRLCNKSALLIKRAWDCTGGILPSVFSV